MELRNKETGAILQEYEFRKGLPNVSLPVVLTQGDVEPFGYDLIQPTNPPTVDTSTQYIEYSDPVEVDGVWYQGWEVVNFTEEQIASREQQRVSQTFLTANYVGFWKEFIRSQVYAGIKDAAKVSLEANVTATELISLLGDAKTAHVDPEALQVGIWEVCAQLPEEANAELRALMDKYGMNNYTLAA